MAPRKPRIEFDPDEFVRSRISRLLEDGSVRFRREFMGDYASVLSEAANKEVDQILPFVARELIGQESFLGQSYFLQRTSFGVDNDTLGFAQGDIRRGSKGFDRLHAAMTDKLLREKHERRVLAEWHPLRAGTLERERDDLMKKYKFSRSEAIRQSRRFFLFSGKLREFLMFRGNLRAKTGGVTVHAESYTPPAGSKNAPIKSMLGKLTISIFPKLPADRRRAILMGELDRNSGLEFRLFGPTLGAKLRGPKVNGGHRPLIQPTLYYYATYKIPRILATVLNRRARASNAATQRAGSKR